MDGTALLFAWITTIVAVMFLTLVVIDIFVCTSHYAVAPSESIIVCNLDKEGTDW